VVDVAAAAAAANYRPGNRFVDWVNRYNLVETEDFAVEIVDSAAGIEVSAAGIEAAVGIEAESPSAKDIGSLVAAPIATWSFSDKIIKTPIVLCRTAHTRSSN
jgi:hypothetical protein